jgi:SAM-dependent methyltransferase
MLFLLSIVDMTVNESWLSAQRQEKNFYHIKNKKVVLKQSHYVNEKFDLPIGFLNYKKVLEVGVSMYAAIHNLADSPALKVGIDPLAGFYNPMYPKSTLHVQGRGEELPFISGNFDVVLCLNVLDHTEKPDLVVKEIKRCLEPNGLLLFSVNTFGLPKFLRTNLLKKFDPSHPHHFNSKEVEKLLLNAGFKVDLIVKGDSAVRSWLILYLKMVKRRQLKQAIKYFFAKAVFHLELVMFKCS